MEMIDWAVQRHPEINWLTRTVHGTTELLNKNEHIADAVITIYAALKTDQFKLINL